MAEVNLTRAELVAIMRAGSEAGQALKPATVCPHHPGSEDAAERVRAAAWMRGWLRGRGIVGRPATD